MLVSINVRFYFEQKEHLSYEENYVLCKNNENYKLLNSNMALQILKEVDGAFKSFLSFIKLAWEGKYDSNAIRLPGYLRKDGFFPLMIGFVRVNGNKLTIPYSNAYRKLSKPITLAIPPILANKKIKEIRIMPKSDARFFEIQYTYEAAEEQKN